MKRDIMDNVIQFPAVGSYYYNSERLNRYAGSMMDQGRWTEVECVMTIAELYDQDLVDIDWDPATGKPIVLKKKETEVDSQEA